MEFFKVFSETLDGILFFLQKCWDIDIPTNGLAIKTTRKEVACGVVLTPCCAAHHTPMTLFEQRNKLVSSYILISYLTVVNRGLAEICLIRFTFQQKPGLTVKYLTITCTTSTAQEQAICSIGCVDRNGTFN